MPGQRCDKSNCRFFPCVVVGEEKEMAVRRLFEADPGVKAWRAEIEGVDIWEPSDEAPLAGN